MPADLPNEVEEGHAAAPQLRPAMRSANELPEPWVRLAMARSRAANRPLPHSELGMIAFGLAVLVAAGTSYEVGRAIYLMPVPLPHGLDSDNLQEIEHIWRQVIFPVLMPAQMTALLLGAISLKTRGRKRFGALAILVSLFFMAATVFALFYSFASVVLDRKA
jgi:hypothetical protein